MDTPVVRLILCSHEEANSYLDLANTWIQSKGGFFTGEVEVGVAEFLANQDGKTIYKHFAAKAS